MENKQFKSILQSIVIYYTHNRMVGHSHAMLYGVNNSERNPVVVYPTFKEGQNSNINVGKTIKTLTELPKTLLGEQGKPLIFEHTTLENLFVKMINVLDELEIAENKVSIIK